MSNELGERLIELDGPGGRRVITLEEYHRRYKSNVKYRLANPSDYNDDYKDGIPDIPAAIKVEDNFDEFDAFEEDENDEEP